MFISQIFSGNLAPSQMCFAGQYVHVSFIFQVVQWFQHQPLSHDCAPSATRLQPPPRRVLWSVSTECTWNPHFIPLNCGDLHLRSVRVLLHFSIIYIFKVVLMYGFLGLIDSPWSISRGSKPVGALVRSCSERSTSAVFFWQRQPLLLTPILLPPLSALTQHYMQAVWRGKVSTAPLMFLPSLTLASFGTVWYGYVSICFSGILIAIKDTVHNFFQYF